MREIKAWVEAPESPLEPFDLSGEPTAYLNGRLDELTKIEVIPGRGQDRLTAIKNEIAYVAFELGMRRDEDKSLPPFWAELELRL